MMFIKKKWLFYLKSADHKKDHNIEHCDLLFNPKLLKYHGTSWLNNIPTPFAQQYMVRQR